jgi:acetyltransferase-like isoleucine patch superfamily enzyme
MLANSSNSAGEELKALKAAAAQAKVHWKGRFLLLGLNLVPLIHIASTTLFLCLPYTTLPIRVATALAFLYLAPAVVARIFLLACAIPEGRIAIGTKSFFVWWLVFQLQIVFCRLPALEEALRFVPGLYSQWLRLWGSKIGRFTYWSPGTLITDRSFLSIGDDVVLGAGIRLNPHVLAKDKDGSAELLLARVQIGDRAMVGGYSLLTAGTEIAPDEFTRAFLISPPFSRWKEGKRIRGRNELE